MSQRKITSASIANDAVASDQLAANIQFPGDYIVIPSGSTAERPVSATPGMLRYNTTTGLVEQYNVAGWQGIDSPPIVTSYSGVINENTNSTITINGTNFKAGSVVYIEGSAVSGIPRALTTTYISSTQLTASTNATSVNYTGNASYDIKVTNPSGLSATLSPAGTIDRDPIWSTGAGTIATINDAYGSYSPITTLSASDPDGTSITYSITSGSLPTNVSLNSSNGQISGDPSNVSGSTTYTFEVTATSNTQSVPRSFNIIVNPTADGSSSSRAATSASAIKSLTGTTSDGYYWIITPSDGVARQWHCDMNTDGGGWVLVARTSSYLTSNPGHWYDSANAGSFNTSSSGQYRGGGYFNNGSHTKLMWDMSAGGTNRKFGINWGSGNYNTLPSKGHSDFIYGILNDGGIGSGSFGNNSIKGANNFTEQFLMTWSFRDTGGTYDRGEAGPYFMFGAHLNGSHQHYEEQIASNGDSDGNGYLIYAVDWRRTLKSDGAVDYSSSGFVNIWAKV